MEQREIKFRVWDKKRKKMFPISEMFFHAEPIDLGIIDYDWDTVTIWSDNKEIGEEVKRKNEIVLMQFTGLKDKNNKEVYEGDMVKDYSGETQEVIWDIHWNGMGGWNLTGHSGVYEWIGEEEIIGNIYENPELLKK